MHSVRMMSFMLSAQRYYAIMHTCCVYFMHEVCACVRVRVRACVYGISRKVS